MDGILVDMVTEFDLHYYTEVQDLSYLLDHVTDDPFLAQYKKLTEALIGIVEDYSLVNYMTLNVEVCANYGSSTSTWTGFNGLQSISL